MSKFGESIHSWSEVLTLLDDLREGSWIFRGQGRSGDPLKTSLERLAIDRWGHSASELPEIEEGLTRRFKREARRYLPEVPAEEDWIGWLGVMRHHGAPTRLLDWTYSFFVALHFAIGSAKPDTVCSVWAANVKWIHDRVHGSSGILPKDACDAVAEDPNAMKPATVELLVRREPAIPMVYPLNPFSLHERLVLQQGVFLVPGDVSVPFQGNLDALGDPGSDVRQIRICASRDFLRSATQELLRMNVSEATLFPGLDGFARHLGTVIPFPEQRATDRPKKSPNSPCEE
jgi:hypothetical protein